MNDRSRAHQHLFRSGTKVPDVVSLLLPGGVHVGGVHHGTLDGGCHEVVHQLGEPARPECRAQCAVTEVFIMLEPLEESTHGLYMPGPCTNTPCPGGKRKCQMIHMQNTWLHVRCLCYTTSSLSTRRCLRFRKAAQASITENTQCTHTLINTISLTTSIQHEWSYAIPLTLQQTTDAGQSLVPERTCRADGCRAQTRACSRRRWPPGMAPAQTPPHPPGEVPDAPQARPPPAQRSLVHLTLTLYSACTIARHWDEKTGVAHNTMPGLRNTIAPTRRRPLLLTRGRVASGVTLSKPRIIKH